MSIHTIFFKKVEISLTGRGLEQWEEVASLTFAYLALLRSPNGKIPTHFMDECAKLADISWRFQVRRCYSQQ